MDKLLLDQFEEDWVGDSELSDQARNNSIDNFGLVFNKKFLNTIVSRVDTNDEIFKKILDDEDFRVAIEGYYLRKAYDRLREESDPRQGLRRRPADLRPMPSFELQFDPAAIPTLADRYAYADDGGPRAAGAAAAARGYYDEEGFLEVCNWKAPRARSKFGSNNGLVVEGVTRKAFATELEDERMEALLSLAGIGVPMASTLLQFAFPEKYPILDVRALEALGCKARTVYPVSFWLRYLKACRSLANRHQVDIRTLDKALWQWSKEGTGGDTDGSVDDEDRLDRLERLAALWKQGALSDTEFAEEKRRLT